MPHDELIERLHALADRQRRERGDIMYLGEHDPEISEAAEALTTMQAREATLIRERDEFRAHIAEQITHVETRIKDGIELGATVWRIALEDVARENREALGTSGLVEP
jgi:hypothetical protein